MKVPLSTLYQLTMKNYFLYFLIGFLAVQGTANAQNSIKFGVNAGATYSSIRGNDMANRTKAAVDFLAGVSVEYPFTERLSVLGNLNYERKSYSGKGYYDVFDGNFDPIVHDPAFMTGGFKIRGTLNYITLPVNVKYYFNAKKSFYINAGPYAGFFLGETYKVNGKRQTTYNELFKTMDLGLNLGVGTSISVNDNSVLNIELRDCLGLINISKAPVINDDTLKTNSLQLIVGWQFSL